MDQLDASCLPTRRCPLARADGEVVSLVDAGLIGHVTVESDRVRVELALHPGRDQTYPMLTSRNVPLNEH